MNILLFSSPSCYPCEKAQDVIRRVLKNHPDVKISVVKRPNPLFAKYNIVYTPTFLAESDARIETLQGAHQISKINVEGLLRDLEIIQ